MDVIEAIYHRQSIGKMKPDSVSRGDIEKLLGAAVQAPNHYKVRPWRFIVLTGAGRSKLGDVLAQVLKRRFPDVDAAALDKERAKPLRSPVIIAVGVDSPADDPRVLEIENICAAAAACENILLAAGEFGIAGHWRTGDAAVQPEVKQFLGLEADQRLIAFLYLGYPEVWPPNRERPGFEERSVWIE
jgi:nitroreductase